MTPRAKKMQAVANAYAMARAVACNDDMGALVIERTLVKAGYKITKITWREKALRNDEVSPSAGNSTAREAVTVARGVTV